jgi:hypothetical protein
MLLATHRNWLRLISLLCAALLVPGDVLLMAQQADATASKAGAPTAMPGDQLESLVAPIALYPDPLLAQVLVASTYPLEIVQLQQWLAKHMDLKDKALAEAVQKEKWDPSIQGLAALPDLAKQLAENIKWTSELGDAFLAQESDVMDAVQRMRAKAKNGGKLQSNEQMKVETKVVESKNVIVIEQSKPDVIYVPSYDPVVVWGAAPVYAYPPVVYPAGYYAAGLAISFGVGMAMGAMWGGGWGYGAGWGGNNTININNNNNFNRNNINNIGSGNRGGAGNGKWQHNPQHRGGAPYGDRGTANKFGGSARGDSAGTRQANARSNQGQRAGGQPTGGGNRAGGAGNVAANRDGASRSTSGNRGNAGGNAGGDRVGTRQVSSGSSGSRGAFGGAGGGGSAARSSSSRGSSSMGGSRGGGRRR